jgi:kynurenine/2-aminoadipate aminotransferase
VTQFYLYKVESNKVRVIKIRRQQQRATYSNLISSVFFYHTRGTLKLEFGTVMFSLAKVGRVSVNHTMVLCSLRHFGISSYDQYLSERSALRKPSAIRALQPMLAIPGMISLGGGMPNKSTFPFKRIVAELADGTMVDVATPDTIDEAFQYSPTQGIPRLVAHLEDIQTREHDFKNDGNFRLCVTTGSQDGLGKAFDMLLDKGDSLIIESPTYSGSLAYLEPLSCNLVGIETDHFGMVPEKLYNTLENWDSLHPGKRRPKVLYTIPTGGNPTGVTMPAERKQKVYDLAKKYEMLILEDDPYYFLQFDDAESLNEGEKRPRSFYSIDNGEGRVLRFDSFSKLLSSGIRIGFVTGPTELVERLELHSQSTTLHTSGISQALVASYFDHLQGSGDSAYNNFSSHIDNLCSFYQKRRDSFLQSAETHLEGLCEFNKPAAGMFVWIKIHDCENSALLVQNNAVDAKVLLVPGESFFAASAGPSPYVRAAYSTASEEDMDEALRRFALLLVQAR